MTLCTYVSNTHHFYNKTPTTKMMKFCEVMFILMFFNILVLCRDNSTKPLNEHCFKCESEISVAKQQACILERCDCSKSPKLKLPLNQFNQNEDEDEDITVTSTNNSVVKHFLPPPIPHCIESTFIAFMWNTYHRPGIFYYIQYYIEDTRILQQTDVTQCDYFILSNLNPDTFYGIRLIRLIVSPGGWYVKQTRSRFITLKTRKEHELPRPVFKFWIKKWILENHDYTIIVKWKKARDLSCFYKLTYFPNEEGDYTEIDINDPLINNEWNITNLKFGTYTPISITAYTSPDDFPVLESKKKWLNVTIPTCLESSKHKEECIPDTPKNLQVKEYLLNKEEKKNIYNITVKWEKPKYNPCYYIITIHLLDNNTYLTYNETGNSTSTSISEIQLTSKYNVLVTAYSTKGSSVPAVIHRKLISQLPKIEDAYNHASLMEYSLMIGSPVVLIFLVGLFGLKGLLAVRLKNKKRDSEIKSSTSNNFNIHTNEKLKTDEWELDSNKLVIKEILGGGAFGVVHKGLYYREKTEEIEVAIKLLRENPTSEEIQQFHQEIQLMKSVPVYPHLVSLIGCVTNEQLLLVVEYCSKGDLQKLLQTASDKILKANLLNQENDYIEKSVFNKMYEFDQLDLNDIPETKDLISYARQISLGMEYLSSLKVIHRDLAARNVLITENNIAKISDFGLSRDVYYNNIYCKSSGGKLPLRWMALESMTHQIYTTQSDVWSFGILLWEIITMGGTPYPGIPTYDIMGMLKSGYRMKKPDNCSNELYELMCNCWTEQSNARPSFTELRESLDKLLVSYSNYVDLNKRTDDPE